MQPRAVLFDLDDTLIDRCASLARFASVLAAEFAQDLTATDVQALYEVIHAADGDGYRARDEVADDLARLLPWRVAPAAADLLIYWNERFPTCSEASAEMHETLVWLRGRGLRTGIITNGASSRQHPKIDVLRLRQAVDCVVVSEDVGIRKPDPRIFQIALDRLGVAAAETWFVGDNPVNDVIASATLGMTAVWMDRGAPWPMAHPAPRLRIEHLGEVAPLIEQALARGAGEPSLSA